MTGHLYSLKGGDGFVDTRVIEQLWKDQFDYHYCENESFVFPMSIHPKGCADA
jgi:hypothetical protein